MIYCVMVEGDMLTDMGRNLLFDMAQEMMEQGETKAQIRSNIVEGEVTTENEQVFHQKFRA